MLWVLIGSSFQSSNCLHNVMGTHYVCLVNGLFDSIMSIVLITSLVNRQYVSILSPILIGYVFSLSHLSL